jgi:hypothetical protein
MLLLPLTTGLAATGPRRLQIPQHPANPNPLIRNLADRLAFPRPQLPRRQHIRTNPHQRLKIIRRLIRLLGMRRDINKNARRVLICGM